MERYRVEMPTSGSISKSIYISDDVSLVAINRLSDSNYSILFKLTCNVEEDNVCYIQTMIYTTTEEDKKYLNNIPILLENLDKEGVLKYQKDIVYINRENAYACDLDMTETDRKPYFVAHGAVKLSEDESMVTSFYISRDSFIKIKLFFNNLFSHKPNPEKPFSNPKLKNLKFVTMDHIKLDGSATDKSSMIVCNHYTAGCGPDIYRFNFISPKYLGRKLRCFMTPFVYDNDFFGDFTITDFIYEPKKDCIYGLFEVRDNLDNYKCTKVLRFTKEIYDRSNFMQLDKVYEEEN